MGDLEFAGLAVQVYSYYAYFSGMPLDILQEELIMQRLLSKLIKNKR
ncbi:MULTISPECIES: hypothetical protein [Planktothricoides]|uniref:Uncharacterized protein n=1 Tax=Planktothricoides raciborskii FACHB-1370 TaxID=2949576 RepID=A0ABR8EN81_9CYAN|nr:MULTISPECIES: hypothetical protein [Planktothricoides]MBD2547350.1 hypothetical protein [Planktothricoides raciborskii FACHB-1370]MBD2585849.1 hypothetical protein [Planktothricoides raciborskii FACHB-1261]